MLDSFITLHRDEIIRRCRAKVAARTVPPPTPAAEVDHGVPVFLNQLVEALRGADAGNSDISRSAVLHGRDLFRQGLTVSQVVHDYGDVCQAITELAAVRNAPIEVEDFRRLNRCLDDAIAGAVTEFGRFQTDSTREDETAQGTERLGFFAHELRNLINTASVAFEVLKTGNVGIAGSTGTILERALSSTRALIDRSLAEVRDMHGAPNCVPLDVAEFIDELVPGAVQDAAAAGVTLTVFPVERAVTIAADRQVLASVVVNLLQNACKFTQPHTAVLLSVTASGDRVRIDVKDKCGGIPGGASEDLFHSFTQRGSNRVGLGLGLAFSRWAVEAHRGRLSVEDLPGHGCVFTIDLPRLINAAAPAGPVRSPHLALPER